MIKAANGATSKWTIVLGVAVAALVFRVWFILWLGFDGLYGQDPFVHLAQASAVHAWVVGQGPPPTGFFWPLGFAFTALPFTLLLGPTACAVQTCTVFCGVAVVVLVFAICRRLHPEGGTIAGLLAAAVVAVASQPVTSSVVIMSDMPALLWAALACWLLLRSAERSWWLLAAAGAALGAAVATRWVYGVAIPAFLAWLAVDVVRGRRSWWHILVPVGASLALVLPQALLALDRPEGFVSHWMLDWRPGHAFQSSFDSAEGHMVFAMPNWLCYTQPAGNPRYLFPLLGVMLPWGIWRLGREREWGAVTLLIGWAGTAYLLLIGLPHQNLRLGLTLHLPVVVLASLGAVELYQRRGLRRLVLGAVALSLAAMIWWTVRATGGFLSEMEVTKQWARQAAAAVPKRAIVLCLGLTHTLQQYTAVHTRELYFEDPRSLADLVSGDTPVYLLIVRQDVETRWAEGSPGRNLAWLERHAILVDTGRFGPYTLYRIGESLPDRPRIQRQRG